MSRDKNSNQDGAAVIEAEEPTREEQKAAARASLPLSMTPTGTGPHKPRTSGGGLGYAFMSNAPVRPQKESKKRAFLIGGAVALLVVQGAAAVYLVKTKQPKDKITEGTGAGTINPTGERPDAARLYREAKELFAAGNRYAALERLSRMQMLTKDEEILSLAGSLERRIEAANQMDQAQIQLRASKWKEAAFHLEKVLRLDPTDEAKRLFKEANDHLEKIGVATIPTPPPPKVEKPAKKHRPVKVAVVNPKTNKPEPKVEPKVEPKIEPKVEPKIEPKKVEPKVEPKKVEPKVEPKPKVPIIKPEPKGDAPIPHLGLPKRVQVKIYTDSGERSKMLVAVCKAVEGVVTKAVGRSAAGTTAAFQSHLFEKYKGSSGQSVTLYPQVMGFLIAESLVRNKPGVSGRLVAFQESGRLASLADSGWRP